jgi:hypothetical protein
LLEHAGIKWALMVRGNLAVRIVSRFNLLQAMPTTASQIGADTMLGYLSAT